VRAVIHNSCLPHRGHRATISWQALHTFIFFCWNVVRYRSYHHCARDVLQVATRFSRTGRTMHLWDHGIMRTRCRAHDLYDSHKRFQTNKKKTLTARRNMRNNPGCCPAFTYSERTLGATARRTRKNEERTAAWIATDMLPFPCNRTRTRVDSRCAFVSDTGQARPKLNTFKALKRPSSCISQTLLHKREYLHRMRIFLLCAINTRRDTVPEQLTWTVALNGAPSR
jgi:hypothetical protein